MTDIAVHDKTWKHTAVPWARAPRIRVLKLRDCEFLLSRNNVARVAFMGNGRVEMMPVHYVFAEGRIFGRIALGTKYLTWLVRNDVVFEADESDGLFDWRSVIVRGRVSILRSRGSDGALAAYQQALEAIRTLIPDAMMERDPTPYRGFVFAIDPLEITGREASTR